MAGFGTVEKNMVASSKFATLMGKYYERIFVVFRLFLTLSMAKVISKLKEWMSKKDINSKIFVNNFSTNSTMLIIPKLDSRLFKYWLFPGCM